MPMRAFAANTELLLTLAWLASEPRLSTARVPGETQTASSSKVDAITTIQQWLETEIQQVQQDTLYGPIYERLLRHRLARVEWDVLKWAIQGGSGVYFREDSLPMLLDKEEVERAETAVLWEAITRSERLHAHLQRKSQHWEGNLVLGAHALSEHFRLRTPLLIRSTHSSFLIQELLRISLQRVQWRELAAHLLGGVPVGERADPIVTEQPQEGALQLATLKERLSQVYADFGTLGWDSAFSNELRLLCLDMTDVCQQVYDRVRTLENSHAAYAE